MEKTDLTYGGKIKALINLTGEKELDVLYTIEGDTGKSTTTSIFIDKDNFLMITFDFQELKKLVEGE